jgi:lytic cellulose monooxygenase (C1-hydroxylating)
MSIISKNIALAGALAFASKAAAHGIVTGIVADGQYNLGYDPAFQYQRPPPTVAGWSIPTVQDRGFVTDLNGPDIICHKGATPGGAYVQIAAGGTLEFQWTEWPESHHGPVIDYLAPCPGGDCTTVEKTDLKFIKVAEAGLINGSPAPGKWASDDMIANNNTWVVKVPADIAPGKYVWRHETIALHSSHEEHGAQPYPQCVNVEITGSGTNELSGGISATEFYSWTDPGIFLNIYYPALTSYEIPGPPLMEGGSADGSEPSTPSASATGPPYGNSTATSTTTTSAGRPRPTGKPGGADKPTTTTAPVEATESVKPITKSPEATEQPASPTGSAGESPQGPPSPPSGGPPSPPPPPPSKPDTPAVSFTSTFTGRIGKPTKFTCYLEED